MQITFLYSVYTSTPIYDCTVQLSFKSDKRKKDQGGGGELATLGTGWEQTPATGWGPSGLEFCDHIFWTPTHLIKNFSGSLHNLKNYWRPQITNVGKDVEKREPLCTVGGNVNWFSHYGQQYGGSSKKLKLELPDDLAILLLGMCLKKMNINLKRYMHCNIHSNIVYNSQDMEAM